MDTKNNMILAEFLGWESKKIYFSDSEGENSRYVLNFKTCFGSFSELRLKFDIDWNWLMLVVEKINTIEGGRFTFQIMSMDVEIHDYLKGGLYIDFFSGNTPDQLIKSVYEACVEFVKKYNNE